MKVSWCVVSLMDNGWIPTRTLGASWGYPFGNPLLSLAILDHPGTSWGILGTLWGHPWACLAHPGGGPGPSVEVTGVPPGGAQVILCEMVRGTSDSVQKPPPHQEHNNNESSGLGAKQKS